jgi:hypothetical protein
MLPEQLIVNVSDVSDDEILEYIENAENAENIEQPAIIQQEQLHQNNIANLNLADFVDDNDFMNDDEFMQFLNQQMEQEVLPEVPPVVPPPEVPPEIPPEIPIVDDFIIQDDEIELQEIIALNIEQNGGLINIPIVEEEVPNNNDEIVNAIIAADIADFDEMPINRQDFDNRINANRLLADIGNIIPAPPERPIGNIGIIEIFNRIQPHFEELQAERERLAIEQQRQRVLQIAEQERLAAEQQNQERYNQLLNIVDEFIHQREQQNDIEFLEFYRRGRNIIVEYKERNLQLPYDIGFILKRMISEMTIIGIVDRYQKYNLTHFCISFDRITQRYILSFRKNDGHYFDQVGQQRYFWNDDSALNIFKVKYIDLNVDILINLTDQYNTNIYGTLYFQNLNNILFDSNALEYIYNNLLNQRQIAGKSLKNRKKLKKITRKKNKRNTKKTIKQMRLKRQRKTKKIEIKKILKP